MLCLGNIYSDHLIYIYIHFIQLSPIWWWLRSQLYLYETHTDPEAILHLLLQPLTIDINSENLLINSRTTATSRQQWYIISASRPFKLSTQPPLSSLYCSLTNGQKWPVETVIAVCTTAICCICQPRFFSLRLFIWYDSEMEKTAFKWRVLFSCSSSQKSVF